MASFDYRSSPAFLPIADADPKAWYRSRGVVGSVAVVLSQCAALAGIVIDADTLTTAILALVGLIGGAIGLIGRLRANQPIGRA